MNPKNPKNTCITGYVWIWIFFLEPVFMNTLIKVGVELHSAAFVPFYYRLVLIKPLTWHSVVFYFST